MNTAVIVGRAGRDAEIKYFESGTSKATFSIAVDRWDSKTSSNVTDWFNIEVWDKQAEFASNYVKKGQYVAVDGRIKINPWTSQTGEARQSYIILANSIKMLWSKKDAE